jgi:hypothetical protein
METLIDLFELQEPVVETYRESYLACVATPRESIDCSVYYDGAGTEPDMVPASRPGSSSERSLRARLWQTED